MFQATVRDITLKGLGVVDHPNGKVYFIRGVWIGDEGLFRIDSEEKRYGFATLVELVKPSAQRAKVSCLHYGIDNNSCGGCPWLFVNYKAQLDVKQDLVVKTLKRAGVVTEHTRIQHIQASSDQFHYRNRAQVKTDGNKLGYLAAGTHQLVDILSCLVMNSKISSQLQKVRALLPNTKWKKTKELSFFDLDSDFEIDPDRDINKSRPFKQANDIQNQFMKDWVSLMLSGISNSSSAIELFCGTGNFTEILSHNKDGSVVAIEGNDKAVATLEQKQLSGVKAISCNLFSEKNWSQFLRYTKDATLLFLDPPRDGFELIDAFLKKHPNIQRILYISCDLSSFSRDSKKIVEFGFELRDVQPVDQFPQTPHIELLANFQKR